MTRAETRNRWDSYVERLADEMRAGSDRMVDALRGGPRPPGTVRLPQREQLRQYVLVAQLPEQLTPEEAEEADRIWQTRLADRTRAEIAEYVVAMEKLRIRTVGHVPMPLPMPLPAPEPTEDAGAEAVPFEPEVPQVAGALDSIDALDGEEKAWQP